MSSKTKQSQASAHSKQMDSRAVNFGVSYEEAAEPKEHSLLPNGLYRTQTVDDTTYIFRSTSVNSNEAF